MSARKKWKPKGPHRSLSGARVAQSYKIARWGLVGKDPRIRVSTEKADIKT
ncbi:hypothetical protein VTN02DRAFT_2426 [Thermoascus thermophilus]